MNTSVPVAMLLRRIVAADDTAIARVICQVSTEYGLTADKGYMVADPNLDEPYEPYSQSGSVYWVVEREGEAVGGDDVAPFAYSKPDICKLQKTRFITSTYSQGLAEELALLALDCTHEQGFKRCYLETTAFLVEAIGLYRYFGFEHIDELLGCTGHVGCEMRMLETLQRLDIAGVPGNATLTGATVQQPD